MMEMWVLYNTVVFLQHAHTMRYLICKPPESSITWPYMTLTLREYQTAS